MSGLMERLRKLLALARAGVGGERENAEVMLDALMRRHGVTMAELEGEERRLHWFVPKRGAFFDRLLMQVIGAVCGNVQRYGNTLKKSWIGVRVTVVERVEVEERYDAYVRGLRDEMEVCYRAFVQRNDIFHEDAPPADGERVDMEEMKRLYLAMQGMRRVEIVRCLANEGGEG